MVKPKLQAWIFFHDPAVSKLRLAMLFVAGLFDMTPQNDFNHCFEKLLNPSDNWSTFQETVVQLKIRNVVVIVHLVP